ncbi:RNA methyltransferase [Ornithinimicrobium sp. Arc0846-15]|nr:RNA methyltransferase [Ornithinimicrobium laminariae]
MKRTKPLPELPNGATWIDDPSDERLRDYFNLTDVALRRVIEPERGLYLAESEKVIRRAFGAGHQLRSLLMGQRWLEDLEDVVADAIAAGAPVYVAAADVIESMTGFHLHRGALASMQRPVLPDPAELIKDAKRVVVLEDIVDHTNIGAVFRSAAALGMDAVLITPRCADPLYRRAVRVSMGTVFQVPWTRIDDWPAGINTLIDLGFHVSACALRDDGITLDELAAAQHDRIAVVLGSEGEGLTERTIDSADSVVMIPMAGGVDSLNVAAASAVVFYTLR